MKIIALCVPLALAGCFLGADNAGNQPKLPRPDFSKSKACKTDSDCVITTIDTGEGGITHCCMGCTEQVYSKAYVGEYQTYCDSRPKPNACPEYKCKNTESFTAYCKSNFCEKRPKK